MRILQRITLAPALLSLLAAHAQPCASGIDLGQDLTLCDGQTVVLTPARATSATCGPAAPPATRSMVGSPGVYYCTVQELDAGSNLVVNGDFSAGATGFTSGYVPGTGGTWGLLSNEGQYAVASNASATHNNFPPCTDHTGGGNMMVVNGAATAGIPVWCQSITVAPNTSYAFSAWLSTMVAQNPAVLQFTINGQPLGSTFTAASRYLPMEPVLPHLGIGQQHHRADLHHESEHFASGNDFALDDISFTPFCNYTDSVAVTVNPYPEPDLGPNQLICGPGTVVLDATTPLVDTYTWNDGLATGPQLSVTTSGTYWVNVLNGACFGRDSVDVTFLSQPSVDLGPDRAACVGDSVVLFAGALDADYLWHDGSTLNSWTGYTSGEAWVQVTQGPCIAADTVMIAINVCDVVVVIPNVFSPNGDDQNAQFRPIALDGVYSLELKVFNAGARW
ncbi:MAG: hypothetical protein IPJ85_12065, partial [Flavobacteriales bacterium]|nr:hypothetical protein [Flavobacteriales bacterium]